MANYVCMMASIEVWFFSSSEMLLSKSSEIVYFLDSDFIKGVSKSFSESNALFEFLGKSSRGDYIVLLLSILLRSDFYKS